MKSLLPRAAGVAIMLSMAAIPAYAQDLLGSSRAEIQALLPTGATPIEDTADGALITYRDVRIGDVLWENVTLSFDATRHLSSLSMRTRELDYDGLKTRAQAQYKAYVATRMAAMTVGGANSAPMQIRLCEKADGDVEMTFEPLSADL